MPQAFDYTADDKLASLPMALRQRMTDIQQARIDAGHTAANGITYRTIERKNFADDVAAWHKAGKPADGLAILKRRESALRKEGKF